MTSYSLIYVQNTLSASSGATVRYTRNEVILRFFLFFFVRIYNIFSNENRVNEKFWNEFGITEDALKSFCTNIQ
jgi:hypothetical protein